MHDVQTLREIAYSLITVGIAVGGWLLRSAVAILKDIREEMKELNVRNARTDSRIDALEKTTDDHGRRIIHLERYAQNRK